MFFFRALPEGTGQSRADCASGAVRARGHEINNRPVLIDNAEPLTAIAIGKTDKFHGPGLVWQKAKIPVDCANHTRLPVIHNERVPGYASTGRPTAAARKL